MTPRSTGIIRRPCRQLFSFSAANIRFKPSVPEKTNATQSTPGTAERIESRIDSSAKLKITRTTMPKNSIMLSESLVRSSIRRSLRKPLQPLDSMSLLSRERPVARFEFFEAEAPPRNIQGHHPIFYNNQTVGQLISRRRVVGCHEAGFSTGIRLTEEALEELRPGLVETREWFVEKKNRGIVQESARDGQSLLHAAGIAVHRFISAPRQADALDLELEIGAAAGQTLESGVKLKILYSGQITIERC